MTSRNKKLEMFGALSREKSSKLRITVSLRSTSRLIPPMTALISLFSSVSATIAFGSSWSSNI